MIFSDGAHECKNDNTLCNGCLKEKEDTIRKSQAIKDIITNNVKMDVEDFIALGENPNLEKIVFQHEFHKVTLENSCPLSN